MKQNFFIITIILLSSILFSTTRNVPIPYATIQIGIDASINGDVVLVQPGTYYENINFNGKLITVGSLFYTTANNYYISSTIINGSSSGSVVSFNSGENSNAILCGLTITNGDGINGGGIYCNESSPTLHDLKISGNSANNSGGGIGCIESCYPTLENVSITYNIANNNGGGINCAIACSPSLENVTITGNSAQGNGGGIYCFEDSYPILINSILWNDSPQEIYISSGSVTVAYSDIEGGFTGTGNINSNPLFLDPSSGDYHLQATSPCIDAGDPDPIYNDPDGTISDMGAYYFDQYEGPTWYISTTGSDITGTGCEQYPFATIQHGIDTSTDTDTVLVQSGTYVENINYNGKLITVCSLFLTTQDTTYISTTIIDGNQNGSVVTFNNSENSSAVLSGFTITNGLGGGTSPDYYGGGITCKNLSSPSLVNLNVSNNTTTLVAGGIYCYESSPNLQNVTISGNSAFYGGGIYCLYHSHPSLENVIITGNSASNNGGGILCISSNLNLDNVTIADNSAVNAGGGIYCKNYSPILTNVKITGNSAQDGGGIYYDESTPSLVNVNVSNNTATDHGGGIYCDESSPNLLNVTISGNTAAYGGGIQCWDNSHPSLENVIITGNSAFNSGGGIVCINSNPNLENVTIASNSATDHGGGISCTSSSPILINSILWNDSPEEIYISSGSVTVAYSDIEGGFTGTGNINNNPLFLDPSSGDYHLQATSPCIDAGNPDPIYYDPDGTIADMGAFYFDQSGALDPPQNVIIEVSCTDISISWDAVSGANSYNVYSSDDPHSGFIEDESGTYVGESWYTPLPSGNKFYSVKASADLAE